jgi:DNA segregation ATPase FtsK/SpoIIIE, S-DNA-T family
MPNSASKRPSDRRKPAARSQSSRAAAAKPGTGRKSAPVSRRRQPEPLFKLPKNPFSGGESRPILSGISPERRLDLLGTFLALVGLLTLLSVLSANKGSLTGWWVGILAGLVGWGVYVLPVALLIVGIWLILRNYERLPLLALERLVGILLLYINLLAFLDLAAGSLDGSAPAGGGGGAIGGGILHTLADLLGTPGTIIVLLAWLLIGVALTFDISIAEIFHWVLPFGARVKQAWQEFRMQDPDAPVRSLADEALEDEMPEEFTPIIRAPNEEAALAPASAAAKAGPEAAPGAPAPAESPLPAPETTWVLPEIETVLEPGLPASVESEADGQRARIIEETLASFGAPGHIVEIHRGPTVTQYGLEPDFLETRAGRTRVRVSKIVALADDLALALAAQRIRIQAPVPGRAYVGIEVPNGETSRVALREIIESDGFRKMRSPLRFALGKDVGGKCVATDLAAMPHMLIAGTTGSGKSVCVNTILTCFLMNNTPDDLRLILVDPKRVELTGYNGIPHLLVPVVVEADRVVGALQWMIREMENRYHKFSQAGARNIVDYNAKLIARGEKKIPYLVVVIDELADLMMLAPDETERSITRLAQLARATGIHLILATQRPSVDVITGLIKANFPARIAFAVASGVDSRVILDQPGAERLLGKGDMLFQAPDAPAPVRLQGVYVSDSEIQRLVNYWQAVSSGGGESSAAPSGADAPPNGAPVKQIPLWDEMAPQTDEDPLVKEAIDLVRKEGRASISMLQRRMRIGYTRAARIVDALEAKGIVGAGQSGSAVRQVLDYGPVAPPEDADLS